MKSKPEFYYENDIITRGQHNFSDFPIQFFREAYRSDLIFSEALHIRSKKISNVLDYYNILHMLSELTLFLKEIVMAQYSNGDSLPTKMGNWQQLEIFFSKKSKGLCQRLFRQNQFGGCDCITATIHEKPGAAEVLIIKLYETLTGKVVKIIPGEVSDKYTDDKYQIELPLYARHTASSAIKVSYII
jgi:hypothetical protein